MPRSALIKGRRGRLSASPRARIAAPARAKTALYAAARLPGSGNTVTGMFSGSSPMMINAFDSPWNKLRPVAISAICPLL